MTEPRHRALHLELDAYPDDALRDLHRVLDVVDGSSVTEEDLEAVLRRTDPHLLLVRLGIRVGPDVTSAAPSLRLVVTPTTGLDHLDVASLADAGIRVLSLRDARDRIVDVHATAEHTWGLLLACMRSIPRAHADVAAGNWRRARFLGSELSGRTLGIAGHGRLGSRVASYGRAFGMHVLVHDVDPLAVRDLPSGTRAVDAETLVGTSDVLSLHLPLDTTTRGWLNAERIDLLPHGAVVVNTARGELVDESALAAALASGRLGGVAVDVVGDDATWGERTPSRPLLDLLDAGHNLVVTPHIGGWARDAVASTRRLVTELAIASIASSTAEG